MKFTTLRLAGGAILLGLAIVAMTLPEDARRTVGICVGIASLFLLVLSRLHLGDSFSVTVKARALVTKGLYSRIQHPLYFFLDMILWGIIVYFGAVWPLALWVLLLLAHILEARREERVLQAAFGQTYEAYQSHTWF